jgi:hypothetical protein
MARDASAVPTRIRVKMVISRCILTEGRRRHLENFLEG